MRGFVGRIISSINVAEFPRAPAHAVFAKYAASVPVPVQCGTQHSPLFVTRLFDLISAQNCYCELFRLHLYFPKCFSHMCVLYSPCYIRMMWVGQRLLYLRLPPPPILHPTFGRRPWSGLWLVLFQLPLCART
jgi:hypothetical protein